MGKGSKSGLTVLDSSREVINPLIVVGWCGNKTVANPVISSNALGFIHYSPMGLRGGGNVLIIPLTSHSFVTPMIDE